MYSNISPNYRKDKKKVFALKLEYDDNFSLYLTTCTYYTLIIRDNAFGNSLMCLHVCIPFLLDFIFGGCV